MSRRARLRQFIFEFVEGVHVAWALAVVHDCEYNGGHSWGEPSPDKDLEIGWTKVCTNCGACETVPWPYVPIVTPYIANTTGSPYTIRYGAQP